MNEETVGYCVFANIDGPPKWEKDASTQIRENESTRYR
jgi:hypothetical protein